MGKNIQIKYKLCPRVCQIWHKMTVINYEYVAAKTCETARQYCKHRDDKVLDAGFVFQFTLVRRGIEYHWTFEPRNAIAMRYNIVQGKKEPFSIGSLPIECVEDEIVIIGQMSE